MGRPSVRAAKPAAKAAAMTDGQREYETRRAAKAGMSLDRWLEQKRRAEAAEAEAAARTAGKPRRRSQVYSPA